MEFVSLDEVLEGIAACLSVHACSEYPREEKISGSAGLLHQILNNTLVKRPHWVEMNSITKRPVFSDAALYPEGMAILLHTAGWFERERQNHVKHLAALAACEVKGIDPSAVFKGHDMNGGQYPRLQFLRPHGIGFDRAELIEFLDSNQIAHGLRPQTATHSTESTEVSSASASHQVVKARRNLLAPVIETAQNQCKDRFDAPAVWAALLSMVEAKVKPLRGVCEDGIKWQDSSDTTQFLTLRSLRERLRRSKEKHSKTQ